MSMMQSIRSALLFPCLLSFSLLATTAAFPVLSSINDANHPSIYNASLDSTGLITFTKLVLVVKDFGQYIPIPEDEVEYTLKAANRAIFYEVETRPQQRIPYDGFSYRRKEGHMLIVVAANSGEEVTWNQLSRVLHALYGYMTGGIAPEDHHQALDFEFRTLSQKTVGFGLVRYFPPDSSNAQRRASTFGPTSISSANVLGNHTISNLSSYFEFSIPNTPITLVFFSLGMAIPSVELGAGLTNVLRKVRSLENNRPQQSIPDNSYWYRDNVSHVWLIVLSVARNRITWQQLEWAMSGVLHWMQDDHCQELAFDIDVVGEGTIASGNIGYDQSSQVASHHINAMAERTGAAFNSSLQLPDNATETPASVSTGECTTIPNMGLALCFRSFGVQIPAQEVNKMFEDALAKIVSLHGTELDNRVSKELFHHGGVFGDTGDIVSVTIENDPRATITWMGMGRILTSLARYMEGIRRREPIQNPKYQALEFDIVTFGNAKMGTGSVRYDLAGSQAGSIERRANAILTSPLLSALMLNVSGIANNGSLRLLGPNDGRSPGSSLSLYISFHGDAIPPTTVNKLFAQVLLDLPDSEGLVPGDSFHNRIPYSKSYGGVAIDIEWILGYRMTYSVLNRILLDLRSYIDGKSDGHEHFEDLEFELTIQDWRGVANGKFWYIPGNVALTGPRVETGSAPNENPLLLSGSENTTLSRLDNSTQWLLGAPTPFHVPSSPITLWIRRQSEPSYAIGLELFSLFTSALQSITPIVDAHPDAPIVKKTYKYSKPSEQGGSLALNVQATEDHAVSWRDLKDVIEGLSKFYDYDPETGWYRSFASKFDISKDGTGTIGSGNLSLVDPRKS